MTGDDQAPLSVIPFMCPPGLTLFRTALTSLDLSDNLLSDLPYELKSLSRLKEVDVEDNALRLRCPPLPRFDHPMERLDYYLRICDGHRTGQVSKIKPSSNTFARLS